MAGLRLGLAFASPEIVTYLSRIKYPYNINGVTQQIAARKLDRGCDTEVETIRKERARLVEALTGIPVIKKVYPSDANFILVRVDDPKDIYDKLIAAGIIVRDRSSVPGCKGCLRITVGTPDENSKLISMLTEL